MLLHPNFPDANIWKDFWKRANDPNADLEIWHYRVDEHVFIALKKYMFLRKKLPPKGQFLLKNNQKKVRKKRNSTISKKTQTTPLHTHTHKTTKIMSATTDRPPGSFMFCRLFLLPRLFELHHVAHLGDFCLGSETRTLTGWWLNQPIWKILVKKLGIFPNFRGEDKKYWKPPPS